MASAAAGLLADLPDTFRYSDARMRINERQLRTLLDSGEIMKVSRGLYRKEGSIGDDDLLDIAAKSPMATICLRSALSRHGLIDDIPAEYDIAIPRGTWTPATIAPVRWSQFDRTTFGLGRDLLDLDDDHTIGIYSSERSIIDAFRLRHIHGPDLPNETLKRWLRRGGQPSELLKMSRSFPRAATAIRKTLEVLL
ncbi:MAG: type IV toxin-antitoxin system AbiEi family antitoxin domain-containing protein [Nocardioides sp.]|uniref:type IV toxin-antitoxin system AbiEi family antitoxin domain-containing protein n=1 Tax=Nocardioides sp. TaxID=35761 RepID=UPI003D6C1698